MKEKTKVYNRFFESKEKLEEGSGLSINGAYSMGKLGGKNETQLAKDIVKSLSAEFETPLTSILRQLIKNIAHDITSKGIHDLDENYFYEGDVVVSAKLNYNTKRKETFVQLG